MVYEYYIICAQYEWAIVSLERPIAARVIFAQSYLAGLVAWARFLRHNMGTTQLRGPTQTNIGFQYNASTLAH